jgi:hypothetical protein
LRATQIPAGGDIPLEAIADIWRGGRWSAAERPGLIASKPFSQPDHSPVDAIRLVNGYANALPTGFFAPLQIEEMFFQPDQVRTVSTV